MDQLSPTTSNAQGRRCFSAEFKAKAVQACDEPGQSVAGVARRYGLNANLLHKWRKQTRAAQAPVLTVRIDLPGCIVVHWPAHEMADAVVWLKALMA